MSGRPWYKRYPSDFIAGTIILSLEEKGAYSVALDLMYDRGGTIPDDSQWIARVCGCSTRRWNQIRATLIERGKLVEEDGHLYAPIVADWLARGGRETIPVRIRALVHDRDGGRCIYCGAERGPFHIDHVVPVSWGGTSRPENLALACETCNLAKGARTPEAWLQ